MSSNELIKKIEALNEWEQMIEDAKQHADELREAIKEEMACVFRKNGMQIPLTPA